MLFCAKGVSPFPGCLRRRPSPLSGLGLSALALGTAALAPVPAAHAADTASDTPARLTIVGTAAPPAASDGQVQVIDHDTLTRYGDSSLSDALRRVPGLSVDMDGRIQLRGLGNGYTQVLLDGRPVGTQGQGVDLGDIDLSAIERVEIVRGATAADGGEGMAGTIRLYTRQAGGAARRHLMVEAQARHQRLNPAVGLELAGALGPQLDWQAAARWQRGASAESSRVHSQWISDYGDVVYTDQTLVNHRSVSHPRLNASGELAWQDGADRLALGAMAVDGPTHSTQHSALRNWNFDGVNTSVSEGTQTIRDDEPEAWHLEPHARWHHDLADGGALQAQWSWSKDVSHSRWQLQAQDAQGQVTDEEGEDDRSVTYTQQTSLRWDQPLGAGWRMTLGAQSLLDRLSDLSLSDGEADLATLRRPTQALFAQAHWRPDAAWLLEAGWRQEHSQVDLDGQTQRRFTLGLPSLALLWTPTPGLQWHAGLSRSYRQPRMKDLSPNGRSTGDYNQPWYPDVRGNPALRNEVAGGLEAGLTQHLGPAGWSLNLYARRIDDPIVFQVAQNGDGRWVLSPGNLGRARLWGLELRGQIDLAALPADSPWQLPATLRADLTFNQSRVDGQAAPSRLPGQAPWMLNVGWDAHPAGPLGWGATLHYEAGYASRALPTTSFNPSSGTANDPSTRVDQAAQCTLDVYALWALAPQRRLRLRGSQLGADWRAVSHQRQQWGEWRTRFEGSRPWAVALSLEQDW